LKSELARVPKRQELFQTEKKIMEMITNDNVIKLLDHFETKEKHYLVMDYCNEGDLDTFIKSIKSREKRLLSEQEAKDFFK
jgi:serine/threonine-protein kinase ULK/ATG1